MNRSFLWKGDLTFGLVNIPVVLRNAENRASELSFSLLDKRDMAPVGYRKVNKLTGEEVPKEALVKGYEYEDGRYVLLTEEDFKRANVEKTRQIEVLSFVDGRSIAPYYYERPYYLEPDKKNEKAYVLFREALARTGKVGIAKFVIHSREHVGAIFVYDNVLLLETLRYDYEIADAGKLGIHAQSPKKMNITAKELDMAVQLIEGMAGEWNPKSFKDEYQEQLRAFIQKKAKQGKVKTIQEEPPAEKKVSTPPSDIMALLKQSLEHVDHPRHQDGHRPRTHLLH